MAVGKYKTFSTLGAYATVFHILIIVESTDGFHENWYELILLDSV
jgi:hypothetical protein